MRGTAGGLEFVFGNRPFDETSEEVVARLAERPDFYRGSDATAIFMSSASGPGTTDELVPSGEHFAQFLSAVRAHGITLRGVYGGEAFAGLAQHCGLPYLGAPARPSVASLERKRAASAALPPPLTDGARSLDADFAGARADMVQRRRRRTERADRAAPSAPLPPTLLPVATPTLLHRGTLRGGQSLQHVGNIVIVGDVNPGAELVAAGEIIVVGALRGTAHAGAQGDGTARVVALVLEPTQLRIATLIAADIGGRTAPPAPEEASIVGDRIAIAPLGGNR